MVAVAASVAMAAVSAVIAVVAGAAVVATAASVPTDVSAGAGAAGPGNEMMLPLPSLAPEAGVDT